MTPPLLPSDLVDVSPRLNRRVSQYRFFSATQPLRCLIRKREIIVRTPSILGAETSARGTSDRSPLLGLTARECFDSDAE